MKRIGLFMIGLLLGSNAYASECEVGQFVVYSGSCKSETAKVYVRGDLYNEDLNLVSKVEKEDGSTTCEFSGRYSLTVVEKLGKPGEFRLFGCQ